MKPYDWETYAKNDKTVRRWRYFLAHDPYTRWGLLKPRGYPGDATLMDFAYKHRSIQGWVDQSGSIGQEIYRCTSSVKQSASARERIKFIADQIQALCEVVPEVSICSYASGHARELELITQSHREKISKFLAIDSDASSLDEVSSSMESVEKVHKNVFRVSMKDYGQFNLVYSLGLFDYLKDRFAFNLIGRMWEGVCPGGKLLIANLNYSAGNLGYCEAIMDWWMIQRSESEMLALGESLKCKSEVESFNVETIGCFSYLIVRKRMA